MKGLSKGETLILAEAEIKSIATLRGLLAEAERVDNQNEINRLARAINRKVETWGPVLESISKSEYSRPQGGKGS